MNDVERAECLQELFDVLCKYTDGKRAFDWAFYVVHRLEKIEKEMDNEQ